MRNVMIYLNGSKHSFHCDLPVDPDSLYPNRKVCGCNVFHNEPDDPEDSVRCNSCKSRYRTNSNFRVSKPLGAHEGEKS